MTLTGSFRLLFLYDVAEEIRLDRLRAQFGVEKKPPSLRHQAPGYVRFSEPPVVQAISPLALDSGERMEAKLSHYEFGVVSLELELPFQCEWAELVRQAARWVASGAIERLAQSAVRRALEPCLKHFVKPYPDWLSEDYCIVHLRQQPGVSAADLLARRAHEVAQIVRGEQ